MWLDVNPSRYSVGWVSATTRRARTVQATASLDKLQEHEAAAAERQRALERQLAERDAAAAAVQAEAKAAAARAEERGTALQAQQRAATRHQAELGDAKLRAQVGCCRSCSCCHARCLMQAHDDGTRAHHGSALGLRFRTPPRACISVAIDPHSRDTPACLSFG